MSLRLSLGLRLGGQPVAASAPSLGAELWPQPEFDSATGLTLDDHWSISGGQATSDGNAGTLSAEALETLSAGTYRVAGIMADAAPGTSLFISLGTEAGGYTFYEDGNGSFFIDVEVVSPTNSVIALTDANGTAFKLNSFSVKRVGA